MNKILIDNSEQRGKIADLIKQAQNFNFLREAQYKGKIQFSDPEKLKNIKLGIGIPLSYDRIPSEFFDSYICMIKPPYYYIRGMHGNIDDMRNDIVKKALEIGCTHLIMMDTDQIYSVDTIPRLLEHDKDVVGCLVFRRYQPYDPLIFKGTINNYQQIIKWETNELIEVDATGTGCLMFNMNVFKTIKPPWFFFERHNDDDVTTSEDMGFCYDLKQAGYNIYVDTSIPCGHLSKLNVTEETWKLYNKLRGAKLD